MYYNYGPLRLFIAESMFNLHTEFCYLFETRKLQIMSVKKDQSNSHFLYKCQVSLSWVPLLNEPGLHTAVWVTFFSCHNSKLLRNHLHVQAILNMYCSVWRSCHLPSKSPNTMQETLALHGCNHLKA